VLRTNNFIFLHSDHTNFFILHLKFKDLNLDFKFYLIYYDLIDINSLFYFYNVTLLYQMFPYLFAIRIITVSFLILFFC